MLVHYRHQQEEAPSPMPKPFAFVLMPFDKDFDDIYELGIKAAAKEKGVVAERVDEQTFAETVLERIYRQIETADFVIADMTGRNPNVFYEVGYAHSRGKLCTLLTQRADNIPFDLKQHRHLIYGGSITQLKQMLSLELDWLTAETERRKTSMFTIELRKAAGDWSMSTSGSVLHAEVTLVLDIHNRTDRRTSEVDAMYLHTGKGWTFSQNGEECPSVASDLEPYGHRHFVRSPISRLASGAWAPVKLVGRKRLWTKWDGSERLDKCKLVGPVTFEVVTSEGVVREVVNLEVEVEEFPF